MFFFHSFSPYLFPAGVAVAWRMKVFCTLVNWNCFHKVTRNLTNTVYTNTTTFHTLFQITGVCLCVDCFHLNILCQHSACLCALFLLCFSSLFFDSFFLSSYPCLSPLAQRRLFFLDKCLKSLHTKNCFNCFKLALHLSISISPPK